MLFIQIYSLLLLGIIMSFMLDFEDYMKMIDEHLRDNPDLNIYSFIFLSTLFSPISFIYALIVCVADYFKGEK